MLEIYMKRKKEKGKYFIFVALFLSMIYVVQFVSAASIVDDMNAFIDGAVEFFNPLAALLFGTEVTGELLFAKVLFFIIILSMVWLALSKIPFFNPDAGAQLWVIWVVAIAISILGVRFMGNAEWINTIILPYSTLGIVLAAGFPFVIFFILVELGLRGPTGIEYRTIRKVAWILFGVVFIGLFASRGDELGSARNIYFVTAIIAFIVALMDGTFQGMLHGMQIDRAIGNTKASQIDAIQRQMRITNQDYAAPGSTMTSARYNALMTHYRVRLKRLQRP